MVYLGYDFTGFGLGIRVCWLVHGQRKVRFRVQGLGFRV